MVPPWCASKMASMEKELSEAKAKLAKGPTDGANDALDLDARFVEPTMQQKKSRLDEIEASLKTILHSKDPEWV